MLKTEVLGLHERTKPKLIEKLFSATPSKGPPLLYLKEISTAAARVGVGDELARHRFPQAVL